MENLFSSKHELISREEKEKLLNQKGICLWLTGLSGSGKSSLAFDTIYAEGQRRYVESLSSYARQFLDKMKKPKVDLIEGLSPAISIEQKNTSKNPRSTVATVTEIYDYMRVLFARVGIPYSPFTGKPIRSQPISEMVDKIKKLPKNNTIYLLKELSKLECRLLGEVDINIQISSLVAIYQKLLYSH